MPRFYLADGQLSAYSFACGYVQQAKGEHLIELYNDGGSIMHIKILTNDNKRIDWLCYDTLSESRKVFKALCKQYNAKLVTNN